jgi:hypothetical protein
MWRLSGAVRLVGLAIYAVTLAVVWALWGVLVLVGLVLAALLRLLGVSLVGFEHFVAAHRRWWDATLRALPWGHLGSRSSRLRPRPPSG